MSGEVAESKATLSGQPYTGAGLCGPTLPVGHTPANLGQGFGWQLDRVNSSENQKQSVCLASSQGWPRETRDLQFSRNVGRGPTLSPWFRQACIHLLNLQTEKMRQHRLKATTTREHAQDIAILILSDCFNLQHSAL